VKKFYQIIIFLCILGIAAAFSFMSKFTMLAGVMSFITSAISAMILLVSFLHPKISDKKTAILSSIILPIALLIDYAFGVIYIHEPNPLKWRGVQAEVKAEKDKAATELKAEQDKIIWLRDEILKKAASYDGKPGLSFEDQTVFFKAIGQDSTMLSQGDSYIRIVRNTEDTKVIVELYYTSLYNGAKNRLNYELSAETIQKYLGENEGSKDVKE
jgi:hypothetical protein